MAREATSKTLRFRDIRSVFDFDLAVLLVASLAIGLALTKSGAAQLLAQSMLQYGGTDPKTAIVLLFVTTILITAVISNAATVAIVFPLALSLAQQLHISTAPVFVAIALHLPAFYDAYRLSMQHDGLWSRQLFVQRFF